MGKSYLEGVLKEIHVGINPDIMSAQPPSSLTSPHMCVLEPSDRVRDKSRDEWINGELQMDCVGSNLRGLKIFEEKC